MEYKQAHQIAVNILRQLEPVTNFCSIAGSVRREKPEVKDIEIVCVGKRIEDKDMFGELIGSHLIKTFIDIVNGLGTVIKGKPDGRYMQIQLPQGIVLDLFMPQQNDVGRIYCIRTGSADYSSKVITVAWLRAGWCGTTDGLRRTEECYKKDLGNGKHKWICNSKNPTLPPPFPDEYCFYKFLNLQWISPNKRYV